MPDLGDMIRDRFGRMPPVIRWCVVAGIVLGLVLAVILTAKPGVAYHVEGVFGGLLCAGFFVGLMAGCIIDALMRSSRRKKQARERRELDLWVR